MLEICRRVKVVHRIFPSLCFLTIRYILNLLVLRISFSSHCDHQQHLQMGHCTIFTHWHRVFKPYRTIVWYFTLVVSMCRSEEWNKIIAMINCAVANLCPVRIDSIITSRYDHIKCNSLTFNSRPWYLWL